MCAVNVGIAHNYDAAVAQLGHIEVLVDAHTDGGDDIFDLLVFEDSVQSHALDIQNLATQRQDGLEVTITALLSTSTGGNAPDQGEVTAGGGLLPAIGKVSW